jgi:hypothetical protein
VWKLHPRSCAGVADPGGEISRNRQLFVLGFVLLFAVVWTSVAIAEIPTFLSDSAIAASDRVIPTAEIIGGHLHEGIHVELDSAASFHNHSVSRLHRKGALR